MMTAKMMNGEMLAMQEPTDNDQLIDISWSQARWQDLSENQSVDFQERKTKNYHLKANIQNGSGGTRFQHFFSKFFVV